MFILSFFIKLAHGNFPKVIVKEGNCGCLFYFMSVHCYFIFVPNDIDVCVCV